jgi:hypothetical protein
MSVFALISEIPNLSDYCRLTLNPDNVTVLNAIRKVSALHLHYNNKVIKNIKSFVIKLAL